MDTTRVLQVGDISPARNEDCGTLTAVLPQWVVVGQPFSQLESRDCGPISPSYFCVPELETQDTQRKGDNGS